VVMRTASEDVMQPLHARQSATDTDDFSFADSSGTDGVLIMASASISAFTISMSVSMEYPILCDDLISSSGCSRVRVRGVLRLLLRR